MILLFLMSHLNNIKKTESVFKRLKEHNLSLKTDKCRFCHKEIKFLGHIVTFDGVKVNPALIQSVKDFPVPKDVNGVRRFLGLASYYRRFIPQFAHIASPLHVL